MGQAERAFSAASTFLSGVMAISASQFIGAPLKLVDIKFYEAYMAWTKESFAVLMTTITQWWAPTVVRVSGDESMKGQLFQMDDGTLKCNFPHRLILMGNHQLYTDWLYLWWIAYTNKMHGRVYIILKESLKSLPIIGWGMQFYNFIFLSRNWEHDRYKFKKHLDQLKDPNDPMWLLIFPEGTNLSETTREKSAKWAEKTGVPDMKHQLLPRSTGLQFCLQELRASTNWLYDCTIAYEGVPKGMYGQDVFTLKSSLFEGRPPKSVNMYWRRYKISEIPYEDSEAFGRWLLNRWREKDYLLEYYYKFGSFPVETPLKAMQTVEGKRKPNHAKSISTSVKTGGGWDEFLSIFGPITTTAGALSSVDLTGPINFEGMMQKVAMSQQFGSLLLGQVPKMPASEATVRKALLAAHKQNPLPKSLIDQLLKSSPQTQAQMKSVLQTSGPPSMAKKVSKAPGANKAISSEAKSDLAKAAIFTAKEIALAKVKPSTPTPTPKQTVRTQVPLANMSSMITRPISTIAVHTAGDQARLLAAKRANAKGTALPGQSMVAGKKSMPLTTSALKQVGAVKPQPGTATKVPKPAIASGQKAASVKDGSVKAMSVANGVPNKAASVQGVPVGQVKKRPDGIIVGAAAAKKSPLAAAGSKPVGTVKYVNGKNV
jgi:1-acyl-sn-glycerol-3-phosphate acyltransferase